MHILLDLIKWFEMSNKYCGYNRKKKLFIFICIKWPSKNKNLNIHPLVPFGCDLSVP